MTFTELNSAERTSDCPALTICVFCGARCGNSPELMELARVTGRLIGQRGHSLIYGGGGSGIMGALAWAASEDGAKILGVIPDFLHEKERHIPVPVQETQLTDTLHRRKEHMLRVADAFLALPGGFGTLDEILEVLSASCLGVSDKPLVIVNIGGVWDGLFQLVTTLHGLDLISSTQLACFRTALTPDDALDQIERLSAVNQPPLAR
jgi:cytokinin riboside 5'-monophosphate phosphoribohydrolase